MTLRVMVFQSKVVFGVIFQNGFSPKAPSTRSPWLWGEPRGNLEVFCHEATFQECQKSWEFIISLFSETENCGTGSHKVAHHFSAHSRLAKTPSIAIWGKNNFFGPHFRFFQFFLYWTPIGPLLDPYWTL